MKANQSDSDESSLDGDEEIEEMTNLFLMAKEDNSSSDEDEEVYYLYNFNELQDAFDDLTRKFEKLGSKHTTLKNNFLKLEAKVITLEKENEVLMNEKSVLKKIVDNFLFIATKLSNEKENLEKLLGS